jgi:hypothetical protein
VVKNFNSISDALTGLRVQLQQMAYVGIFKLKYKNELLEVIVRCVKDKELDIKPKFGFVHFTAFPIHQCIYLCLQIL